MKWMEETTSTTFLRLLRIFAPECPRRAQCWFNASITLATCLQLSHPNKTAAASFPSRKKTLICTNS